MTDRELMQQALDAMLNFPNDISDDMFESIRVLRARLAQPEQEPVAWMVITMGEVTSMQPHMIAAEMLDGTHQLYTDPQQREWQGLTDEEANELTYASIAEIEAKLKEKNIG